MTLNLVHKVKEIESLFSKSYHSLEDNMGNTHSNIQIYT